MHSTNQNKIIEILDNYQIRYNLQGKLELEPDQDLSIIPSKKTTKMLSLKKRPRSSGIY